VNVTVTVPAKLCFQQPDRFREITALERLFCFREGH
jgi:hypothetical protein